MLFKTLFYRVAKDMVGVTVMIKINENLEKVEYAIRDLVVKAQEVSKKAPRDILYLNIGDPNQYDFDTPDKFRQLLAEIIQKGGHDHYSGSQGHPELLEALSNREKQLWGLNIPPSQFVVTTGVSEAILFLSNIFESGTNVIIPGPSYPSYTGYFTLRGIEVREYPLTTPGWQPDLEYLEKLIDDKTQAILIINPNNPTGSVYSEENIKKIGDLAAQHELLLISDEIYDFITYDQKMKPTSSIVSPDTTVLSFNGISKTLLATGWRLGWLYMTNVDDGIFARIWDGIQRQTRIRLSTITPVQVATARLLQDGAFTELVSNLVQKLKPRRNLFYKLLNDIDGIEAELPQGAFYIFPKIDLPSHMTDKDWVIQLLEEEQVLLVHGSGFGEFGKNHFRSVLLPPEPILEEAAARIEQFMKKIK